MLSYLSLALAGLIFVSSPGPIFTIVTRQSLISFRHGLMTSLGTVLGFLPHILLAIFGTTLATQYPIFLNILGIVGGIYFLYIAYTLFQDFLNFTDSSTTSTSSYVDIKDLYNFRKGFIISVLNVGALFGYTAILTGGLVDASDLSNPILIFVILFASVMIWFPFLSFFFSSFFFRKLFRKYEKWLNLGFGLFMIYFAVQMIF